MKSAEIMSADEVQQIANAPVNLIYDKNGMVIGNSQALAQTALIIRAVVDEFTSDIKKAFSKLEEI